MSKKIWHSVGEIAEKLGMKPRQITMYLLEHSDIKPKSVKGVALYPFVENTIQDVLGIGPIRKGAQKLVLGSHDLLAMQDTEVTYELVEPEQQVAVDEDSVAQDKNYEELDNQVKVANIAAFDSISSLVPGRVNSEKAKQNEARILSAIKGYIDVLDKVYSDRVPLAFHTGYFFSGFDLIMKCNYQPSDYELREKEMLKTIKGDLAKVIAGGIHKKAPEGDTETSDQLLKNPFVKADGFFDRCLGTYILGKEVVNILTEQGNCGLIVDLREGLEIKMDRIYKEIATKV